MEYEVTLYVEVPIKILVENTPAEAPCFNESCPCPGSPESNEVVSIVMPEVPTTGKAVEQWLDANCPNWLEKIDSEVEKKRL